MISRLRVQRFKRFADCALDLVPLTLLTGLNGSGKTSILHALVLAHEACSGSAQTVELNGPSGLQLGTAEDVLNTDAAEPTIAITLDSVDHQVQYGFDASDGSRLYLKKIPPVFDPVSPLGGSPRAFSYLCAERLGPRSVLGASARDTEELGVGVQGEHSAQLLALHGHTHRVPQARRHTAAQNEEHALLKYQAEVWLSEITRPVQLKAEWFPRTAVTSLRFGTGSGDDVLAPNMGFGLSYALPIVLAGLYAPERGLLIVENPEAHLHPAGQSKMGIFLSVIARSGVQVIVETHSDHVLNGVRRAIADQLLPASAALVQFFDDDTVGGPRVQRLSFTARGGLSEWPPAFFDQYQLDVAALSRARREPSKE